MVEAERYLNPLHWGGHHTSDGHRDARMPRMNPDAREAARGYLSEHIRSGASTEVVGEPLAEGERFSAGNYSPGTIVVMRDESLLASNLLRAGDMQQFSHLELPPQPTFEEDDAMRASSGYVYSSIALWGVVVKAGWGRHGLWTAPRTVFSSLDGIVKTNILSPMSHSFNVGETRHSQDQRSASFDRTVGLYVCRNVVRQGKGRRIIDLFYGQ